MVTTSSGPIADAAFSRQRRSVSMPSAPFIDVLIEQIRRDLREEVAEALNSGVGRKPDLSNHSELHGQPNIQHETLMSWLLSHTPQLKFSPKRQKQNPYHSVVQKSEAQPSVAKPEPTLYKPESAEEIAAAELISRHSKQKLTEGFTKNSLQSAWRSAARNTHPDCQSQASPTEAKKNAELFCDLKASYDYLSQRLKLAAR